VRVHISHDLYSTGAAGFAADAPRDLLPRRLGSQADDVECCVMAATRRVEGHRDRRHAFISHLAQTDYATIYRLADAPPWLLNAEIVPLIVLFSMMAAMLHVAATGSIDGEVPRRCRIALGTCVGAAVLVVGAPRPDIGPAIERTRPHVGDQWRTGEIWSGGSAATWAADHRRT
jgi:hypothetical protein